ncbi:Uncharacterised protein [Bordetella pertussis]|nr:Uncharacterised protein [Bordetella pertussis]
MLKAMRWPAMSKLGWRAAPRSKSPSGMSSMSTNQRNPGGTYSPQGTRCCLS